MMGRPGCPGRVAVVDIGTNTIRLLLAEQGPDGHRVLDEFGEVTSLGASLTRTGRIGAEDIQVSEDCLIEAVRRAHAASAELFDLVGTEVFRRAANGREVANALSVRIGHPIRILSVEEEGAASYLGATSWSLPLAEGPTAVLDVGGGSTELVQGIGAIRKASISLPVGALVVTDRFLDADPPGAGAVSEALSLLAGELAFLAPGRSGLVGNERLLAVGGSACATAAWVHGIRPFDAGRINGLTVSREAIRSVLIELAELTIRQRMDRGHMGKGRARVLLGGSIILLGALQAMEKDSFETSGFGLRHGRALLSLEIAL